MASLKYTQESNHRPRSGFTIVELLVVIVVIAILAAIVVVAYRGISDNAVDASMKSDLKSAADELAADYHRNKQYPALATEINNGQGLKQSGGNSLLYKKTGYGYCIGVTNPAMTKKYYLKSDGQKVLDGTCDTVIATLAGSGTQGSVDANGTAAQFYYPVSVAVDNNGTVYVADSMNHRIRKISPSGEVTTFAGSTSGYADGVGTSAQFRNPSDIALSSSGVLYVADYNNHVIRKITPDGTVSTLAGRPVLGGFADGQANVAQFWRPEGLTLGSDQNIYVADELNNRIRKVSPTGYVTTIAGSGTAGNIDATGTAAQFRNPSAVSIDASNFIYVADYGNHRIRKISPSGEVTTFAGSTAGYTDGAGSAARFNNPSGLVINSDGLIYVADAANQRIRQITPAGVVTTIAGAGGIGSYADGMATTARFNYPRKLALGADGTLYIADSNNNRIRTLRE